MGMGMSTTDGRVKPLCFAAPTVAGSWVGYAPHPPLRRT